MSEAKKPEAKQPESWVNFTRALTAVLSVRKTDIDAHKPVRPRKAKRA